MGANQLIPWDLPSSRGAGPYRHSVDPFESAIITCTGVRPAIYPVLTHSRGGTNMRRPAAHKRWSFARGCSVGRPVCPPNSYRTKPLSGYQRPAAGLAQAFRRLRSRHPIQTKAPHASGKFRQRGFTAPQVPHDDSWLFLPRPCSRRRGPAGRCRKLGAGPAPRHRW